MESKTQTRKMRRRNISTDDEIWQSAKNIAGPISMSALIRSLLELFIEGTVTINQIINTEK